MGEEPKKYKHLIKWLSEIMKKEQKEECHIYASS